MDEDSLSVGDRLEQSPFAIWRGGVAWFRQWIPTSLPWGRESLLETVPEEARGLWGARVGGYVHADGHRYAPGEIVTVGSEAELLALLPRLGSTSGLIVPLYDRIVPATLVAPHRQRIELSGYRREYGQRFLRALAITAALVWTGYVVEFLFFPALLFATLYGLFPLVEASMALSRRPDRLPVAELNRRTVNFEFFRRWLAGRRSRLVNASLGALALVFLAQTYAGLGRSIEAAALMKERVLEGGEWWRVVTTGLMHGNIVHILFNGMALYSLGRVLVALVSPPLLVFVFLFTVVTGSLASLWLGPGAASVGASGGILGCLGFLLVVTAKFRAELPGFLRASLLQSTLVVAIFGLLGAAFIDNAAHAGGFLGGVFLGLAGWPWLRLAPPRVKPAALALAAASGAVLVAGVLKILWELLRSGQM
jgi:membrane associated rhomboid family serine protease